MAQDIDLDPEATQPRRRQSGYAHRGRHYPEGAGHATWMLVVVHKLEARDASISLTSCGPGERFVNLLRYDEYVPIPVDLISDYQERLASATLWRGVSPQVVIPSVISTTG